MANTLKAGVQFPLGIWGPLSILSNACSIGHQFPRGGSEKHDYWLGKRTCHWYVFLHILLQ